MEDVRGPISPGSTRFMDRFRLSIRARQLAYKTEKTYCYWVLYFIRFHHRKNPADMGKREVETFLEQDLGELKFSYTTRPVQLPTVFTHDEATRVINLLKGLAKLGALLMYGSGLRVSEVARLRVQDVELDRGFIVIREAKGLKSRARLAVPVSRKPAFGGSLE